MGSINAAGYDWNEPIAPDPDRVPEHDGCPHCGETRVDALVIDEDHSPKSEREGAYTGGSGGTMRNPTPEYTLIWTLTQWLVRAQANGRVIDQACERSDREGLAVLLARAGEWMAEKDSAEVSNG